MLWKNAREGRRSWIGKCCIVLLLVSKLVFSHCAQTATSEWFRVQGASDEVLYTCGRDARYIVYSYFALHHRRFWRPLFLAKFGFKVWVVCVFDSQWKISLSVPNLKSQALWLTSGHKQAAHWRFLTVEVYPTKWLRARKLGYKQYYLLTAYKLISPATSRNLCFFKNIWRCFLLSVRL